MSSIRKALRRIGLAWLLTLATHSYGQSGNLPFEEHLFNGRAVPFYGNATTDRLQTALSAMQREGTMERFAGWISNSFRLRADLMIGSDQCGSPNAFYDPRRRALVICLEMIELVAETIRSHPKMSQNPPEVQTAVSRGILTGIILHELGHALIHLNRIPTTGREEDVADQFQAWFAARFTNSRSNPILMPTIWFWSTLSREHDIASISPAEIRRMLADEHSLDMQRVFNLTCLVAGAALPEKDVAIKFSQIPDARLQRCAGEWAGVDRAMQSQFRKYLKTPR
jgi:hypothetical protein